MNHRRKIAVLAAAASPVRRNPFDATVVEAFASVVESYERRAAA